MIQVTPQQLEEMLQESSNPFDKIEVKTYTAPNKSWPENEDMVLEILIGGKVRYKQVASGGGRSYDDLATKQLESILYNGLFYIEVAEAMKKAGRTLK